MRQQGVGPSQREVSKGDTPVPAGADRQDHLAGAGAGRHGRGVTPPGLPPGCPPWFARPAARAWTCAPAPAAGIRAFHAGLPGYAPTPLTEVPAIAAELGVGRVFVKDESARMGLAAFKVLGASWAVHQVLSRRDAAGPVTLVAATDGNHGRALAWMAGCWGSGRTCSCPAACTPRRSRRSRRRARRSPRSPEPTTMRSGSPPRRPANRTPTRAGRRLAWLRGGARLDRRRLLDPVRRGRRAARGRRSGRGGCPALVAIRRESVAGPGRHHPLPEPASSGRHPC